MKALTKSILPSINTSTTGKTFARELNTYRLLILIGAVLIYPLFVWVSKLHSEEAFDPNWQRFAVAGVCLFLLGLSYVWSEARKRIELIFNICCYLVTFHFVFLAYSNGFSLDYQFGFLMIVVICALSLKRVNQLFIYSISTFTVFILAYILGDGSTAEATVTLSAFGGIYVMIVIALSSRLWVARDIAMRQELMNNLYELSTDALFIIEPISKRIVDCNENAVKMFKYESKDKLIGKHYGDLGGDNYSDKEKEVIWRTLIEKGIWEMEKKLTTPNGKTYWANLLIKEIDARGEQIWLVRHLNITKQKEYEIQLKDILAQLGRKNKELKDFAHVISHDLKAPLRNFSTYTTLLERQLSTVEADTQELMDLMKSSVRKMTGMIDGVLSYAKSADISGEIEEVCLNEVYEVVSKYFLQKPSNMQIVKHDSLPLIKGHRTLLTQLFQNLIGNAIKYNDKENGKIEIGVIDKEVYIRDNGPGIEERYFDSIFKLFQKLPNRSDEDSSGVGLSIVKKIIEVHRGLIRVESEVGQGTTFFLQLPAIQPSQG